MSLRPHPTWACCVARGMDACGLDASRLAGCFGVFASGNAAVDERRNHCGASAEHSKARRHGLQSDAARCCRRRGGAEKALQTAACRAVSRRMERGWHGGRGRAGRSHQLLAALRLWRTNPPGRQKSGALLHTAAPPIWGCRLHCIPAAGTPGNLGAVRQAFVALRLRPLMP